MKTLFNDSLKLLNQQLVDKYILDEFGEIPNPLTEEEIIDLINDHNLTLEKVKLWSLFGGDLTIKGKRGKTIIHSASYVGQLDIIEYVLDKKVDIDCLTNYKSTPLMYASCNGHINVINLLLDRGANINHQDKDGWSALHVTCNWNQLESVKLFIDRGINIHLKSNYTYKYRTALQFAQYYEHQEIIDYLTPLYNKQ